MEKTELKAIIEALIFAADHPLSLDKIAGVLSGIEREAIKDGLTELTEEYQSRESGLFIEKVAGGFQLRTRAELTPWIKKLFKTGMKKVSRASMESLAIVAYKQPITRAELESIRGVDSAGVLGTLMDRRLIKIVGRKETPGRPPVYGTTKEFLEAFDLKNLSHLPSLKDLEVAEEDLEQTDDAEENREEDSTPEEITEDTGGCGNGLPQESRADDSGGESPGESPDGDRTRDEGGPA
ncbi:MAG: SMC-Scp complex subunit ScpB [Thermodesulfobacteriota bacterium]